VPKIRLRLTRINYALAAAVFALATIAIIVRVAESERGSPARCPSGLQSAGARCCGIGQELTANGQCTGNASSCTSTMERDENGGCIQPEARVHFSGGNVHFGASDWEGEPEPAHDLSVSPFDLDQGEVTVARFRACADAGQCPKIPEDAEPGRPVRNVSPDEASAFCASVSGRLPTADEWLFAAAGSAGRRYPWGNTGLVCRRASFGLSAGPCATTGTGPDLVGARPDGATPEGVLDLAGNVAEWTRERDASYAARGGSYRSELAGELKTWAKEARQTRAPHVGFRCAYTPRVAAN